MCCECGRCDGREHALLTPCASFSLALYPPSMPFLHSVHSMRICFLASLLHATTATGGYARASSNPYWVLRKHSLPYPHPCMQCLHPLQFAHHAQSRTSHSAMHVVMLIELLLLWCVVCPPPPPAAEAAAAAGDPHPTKLHLKVPQVVLPPAPGPVDGAEAPPPTVTMAKAPRVSVWPSSVEVRGPRTVVCEYRHRHCAVLLLPYH